MTSQGKVSQLAWHRLCYPPNLVEKALGFLNLILALPSSYSKVNRGLPELQTLL